jgi:3-methyladenine DNA glycosylase AlkD
VTAAGVIARRIERALAPHVNAERRAVLTGGYAPTGLQTLGVAVPKMRPVVRAFAGDLRTTPPRAILRVALALVRNGTVEGRQVGYELISRRRDVRALLTARLVEHLGRGNDNWASVDGFAVFVSGPAWSEGRVGDHDVVRWAQSRDRWWRRTALASTVALNVAARGGQGDTRRTLLICSQFVGGPGGAPAKAVDAMLAKALSWSLRSLVKHDADAVRTFVGEHAASLPAIVRREVDTKLRTGRKSAR